MELIDGGGGRAVSVREGALEVFLSGQDASAEQAYRLPSGVYMVPVHYIGGTDASGSFVFAIRNGASKLLQVKRVFLTCSFNGTAAATSSIYELVTLSSISADSGGSSFTPGKKRAAWPASGVTSVRTAGAVTLTGNAVTGILGRVGCARQVGSSARLDFDASDDPYGPIEIAAGAGLAFAIRLQAAAIAGDTLEGFVEFAEF
jgi:hypothetical protein